LYVGLKKKFKIFFTFLKEEAFVKKTPTILFFHMQSSIFMGKVQTLLFGFKICYETSTQKNLNVKKNIFSRQWFKKNFFYLFETCSTSFFYRTNIGDGHTKLFLPKFENHNSTVLVMYFLSHHRSNGNKKKKERKNGEKKRHLYTHRLFFAR